MSIEVPRGATVWLLLEQTERCGIEVRVFATKKGAQYAVDGRIKEEAQHGREWVKTRGDLAVVDSEWTCGKELMILKEMLVRRP